MVCNFLSDSKLNVIFIPLISWCDIKNCVIIVHYRVSHMPSVFLDLRRLENSKVALHMRLSQPVPTDEELVEIHL